MTKLKNDEVVKTESDPATDQSTGDSRADQLLKLVDDCVEEDMQIPIIAQKVGTLNATFAEPIKVADIIDLLGIARDKLVERRKGVSLQ